MLYYLKIVYNAPEVHAIWLRTCGEIPG